MLAFMKEHQEEQNSMSQVALILSTMSQPATAAAAQPAVHVGAVSVPDPEAHAVAIAINKIIKKGKQQT